MSEPQPRTTRRPPASPPSELHQVSRRLRKTTSRLQRLIEAIRNKEAHPGELDFAPTPSASPGTGFDRVDRRHGRATLDYPVQGKLQAPLPAADFRRIDIAPWEPAESLYIAILVGAGDLNSGKLRDAFRTQRRQQHDAMVYRWQGEFTLDVLGFDAIDPHTDRNSGQVDIILLSDGIARGGRTPAALRELERVAMMTRLRFPDSYLVGLFSDSDPADLVHHAFHTVERKARTRGITVFDQYLAHDMTPDRITRLLVSYAKSRRYAANRSVWLCRELGEVPIPIPKEDVPPGS